MGLVEKPHTRHREESRLRQETGRRGDLIRATVTRYNNNTYSVDRNPEEIAALPLVARNDGILTFSTGPLLWVITLTLIFLLIQHTPTSAADLSIDGYCKSFFIGYDTPRVGGPNSPAQEPMIGAVTNRIRGNVFYRASDWLSLNISYNILPRVQDPSLFVTLPDSAGTEFPTYRFADFDARLYPKPGVTAKSFGVFHNLDRAALTLTTRFADLYLGRQAIAWGSARVVNATDILVPFSFDELDAEDRIGVDAVRLRVPLGFMGELDAGYVFGDDFAFDQSAFFLRGKSYVAKTDISSMIVGFRENLLVGLDLARSISGAGLWLETGYVFVGALDNHGRDHAADYFRGTIGTDLMLTAELYVYTEYHFSQAGSGHPGAYLSQLDEPAFTDGAVYLLGRHYLIPGCSYQFTPLLTVGGQTLINLEDPSVLFAPNIEYNIAEDIYLAAGAFVGIGKHPEHSDDNESSLVFRSEFGGYSDMYYTSFRLYF